MCDTVAKVLERRRELKPKAGALSYRRGNNCNRRIESANGRRLRLVAGLAAFLSVALRPARRALPALPPTVTYLPTSIFRR